MSEACEENLAWIAAGQVKDKTRRRAEVQTSGQLQELPTHRLHLSVGHSVSARFSRHKARSLRFAR